MTDLRIVAQQALEALVSENSLSAVAMQQRMDAITALHAALAEPVQEPVWVCPDSAEHRYQKPGHCEDCGKTLVQEPVQFEPQEAVTEDGWCEWVCPKPTGYLMQCCDCGLIHEVDSRVAKYQPRPSEEFEVVDDPDLQVQWRMKRRDDISPKRKPLTEDEIALIVADCSASAHRHDDFSFARAIERAHGIGEQP